MNILQWLASKMNKSGQATVTTRPSPQQGTESKQATVPARPSPQQATKNKEATETAQLSQQQVEALAKPVLDYLWKFQVGVVELSETFKPPSDLFVFGVRNNALEPGQHLTENVRQLDDSLKLGGKLVNMLERIVQSVHTLRDSVISVNGAGARFGLCQEYMKQVAAMKEYLQKFAPGYSFSTTVYR